MQINLDHFGDLTWISVSIVVCARNPDRKLISNSANGTVILSTPVDDGFILIFPHWFTRNVAAAEQYRICSYQWIATHYPVEKDCVESSTLNNHTTR